MKKTIWVICIVLLTIISIIVYNIKYYQEIKKQVEKTNKEYESFYNVEVLGTDLASLINKIENSNSKNKIEKDDKGIYINNDKNSIKMEVKFLERDSIFTLEKIEEVGIDKFVYNFGAMKFKCTKINYHEKTKLVKYMYFEQIN